jgi:ribonucleoside-diphosphate reductase beta chain
MGRDVLDWEAITDSERKIISGILRGFTQTECTVSDYWGTFVPMMFPKPEIKAVCSAFSFFEYIHAAAYNHLSSTLGINEEEAYNGDALAQSKVHFLMEEPVSNKSKLAIFSGAAEGVALFSSFSILLSFVNRGLFKGLGQIISWSISDEDDHSKIGISLLNEYVTESPLTPDEIVEIIDGFEAVVKNELAFLDNVFYGIDEVNGISLTSFKNYIYYRANNKLLSMGIPYQFNCDLNEVDKVSSWFEPLAKGVISNDFFSHAKEGSIYNTKVIYDFSNVDWSFAAA